MTHVEFVRSTGAQGSVQDANAVPGDISLDAATEAYFGIEGNRHLFFREVAPGAALFNASLAYLGHCIFDHPEDLRSHVQRIFLLIKGGESDELQDALIDLFIALGGKGRALKRHVLDQARLRLSHSAFTLLEQHLDDGFAPWAVLASPVRLSLLSLGYCGAHELVRRLDGDGAAYANVVEEARDRLAYGQVDAAREVLEQALRKTPGHAVVAAELLEIYRHTKDTGRLASMTRFLKGALPVLPTGWRALNDLHNVPDQRP